MRAEEKGKKKGWTSQKGRAKMRGEDVKCWEFEGEVKTQTEEKNGKISMKIRGLNRTTLVWGENIKCMYIT